MDEFTRKFNAAEDKEQQVHHILTSVYESLKEKGYDPINQIVGYILSEDPTYITVGHFDHEFANPYRSFTSGSRSFQEFSRHIDS